MYSPLVSIMQRGALCLQFLLAAVGVFSRISRRSLLHAGPSSPSVAGLAELEAAFDTYDPIIIHHSLLNPSFRSHNTPGKDIQQLSLAGNDIAAQTGQNSQAIPEQQLCMLIGIYSNQIQVISQAPRIQELNIPRDLGSCTTDSSWPAAPSGHGQAADKQQAPSHNRHLKSMLLHMSLHTSRWIKRLTYIHSQREFVDKYMSCKPWTSLKSRRK